jgi:hypothetical protein
MNAHFDALLDEHANTLQRWSQELIEINERVARLGMALGLHLEQPTDVQRVLDLNMGPLPKAPDKAHRFRNEWKELRGLMVMRYRLEKMMSQSHGASTTRELLEMSEAALAHKGFRPGQDGLSM